MKVIACLFLVACVFVSAVSVNKNVAFKNGEKTLNCASFKMQCPNQDELNELLGQAKGTDCLALGWSVLVSLLASLDCCALRWCRGE